MPVAEEKQALRNKIALLKKGYSPEELLRLSAEALSRLEGTDLFRNASCVALYHAIPGEVQTAAFIEKWYRKKSLLLPLIVENELKLLLYQGKESLQPGRFGIWEPAPCCPEIDEKEIGCILVPGIAFDRQRNRMGRGKGYYDRLLQTVRAPKIGIGFHFQLFEQVPADTFDKKMDAVVTDREIV